jgi:hypothetical protein
MKKGIFVVLVLMLVVLTACSSSPTGDVVAEGLEDNSNDFESLEDNSVAQASPSCGNIGCDGSCGG